MIGEALIQMALASIGAGLLVALGLGARAIGGSDPRARERILSAFVPLLLLAPAVQFTALRFLPESWRLSTGSPPALSAPAFLDPFRQAWNDASRAPSHDTSAPLPADRLIAPGNVPQSVWHGLPTILIAAYLAGTTLGLARLVRAARAAAAIADRAAPVTDPEALAAWSEALHGFPGLARTPRFLVSPSIASPACAGLLRPCVLIPHLHGAETGRASLAAALRHELAHASRYDPLRSFVEGGLLALHWLNPAVFVFVRMLRADREYARDAQAALAGGGPRPYALALIRFAELARSHPAPRVHLAALSTFVSPWSVQRRLTVMSTLNVSARPFGPRAAAATFAALLFGAACTALHASVCAGLAADPPRSIGPAPVKSVSNRRVEVSAPPGPRRMTHVVQSLGKDPGRIKAGADTIGTLTEQETVADFLAEGAPDAAGTTFRAQELRANLPEGSGLTLTIEGSEVLTSHGVTDIVRFTAKEASVRITDSDGVSRLVATSVDPGSTFTIVARENAGEASFHIMAHRNDKPVDVSITIDAQTGRATGEKDPPAGSVRWQLLPASTAKPATRLKIQWIHDDRTLAEALKSEETAPGGAR